jgi:hypothetical protein
MPEVPQPPTEQAFPMESALVFSLRRCDGISRNTLQMTRLQGENWA